MVETVVRSLVLFHLFPCVWLIVTVPLACLLPEGWPAMLLEKRLCFFEIFSA